MSDRSEVSLPYSSMVNENNRKIEDSFEEEKRYPEIFTYTLESNDNYDNY